MGGREKGRGKGVHRDRGQGRSLRGGGGDVVAKEDPVMQKQRWREEHVLRTLGQSSSACGRHQCGHPTVSKGTAGLSQVREKEEGCPSQGFSSHRIQ